MKYKAGKDFKALTNKHFGPHKTKALLAGEIIDITDPSRIPTDVKNTLEETPETPIKKEKKKEVK